ncbi:Retrovirus-related Pol polyprotein from transposon TNT 1-94 [Trichinella murrelli]|uniref:Retrovirus-related Pol polyprotein from transposon TNT 1-94 n=1 Tax=Trichinella murrelli TaxID=144512 RepID=A0A0V0T6C5_9BILA|nr:Retrovirus-related Pol polyprotein from transposon TNT 1-94 [Trichinella murrelli]
MSLVYEEQLHLTNLTLNIPVLRNKLLRIQNICTNEIKNTHVQQVLNNHGIKVHAQEQFCTDCVLGKHHREGFQSRKYRPRAPGKLIHVDLCRPMHVTPLGGPKYFLIFEDDFSRYRRDFFLKRKDDVAQCRETFLDESRTAGNTVECILRDGGLEFNNAHVKDILQRRRVAMHTAMPYTPEHNGVPERENRILVETGRSMFLSKDLPFSLWAEAVNTACNVLNRIGPTTVKGKSQIELWFKRDPVSIDHFHGFRTECFVHVPKQLQRKWEKKSVAGRLMGYCDEKDGYRIWLPDINQIVTSRGVLFKPEKIRLPSQMSFKVVSFKENEDEDDSDAEELRVELHSQWTSKEAKCEVETNMEREEEKSEQASRSNKQEEVALSSKQVRKMPNYLSDYVLTAQTLSPSSFHEAMQSRLYHQNKPHVQQVLNNHGIKVHAQEQFCTGCVLGKHHREGFLSRKYRARPPGKLIHVDLCGPMHVTYLGGSKYFLIFKDDFSRYRRDFFLKRKDDVAQCLETFLDESRTAGNTVECILSDGGLEFNNAHVKDILQRRRVAMRTAMPYTPEHNRVAERENRILVETGRSMLHSKDFPFSLQISNRTVVQTRTVSIDHFHGFGTEFFVHVPKQLQRKWEKKSVAGRLMGYCDEKDGYRIWLPDINQIVASRGVLFKPEKIRLPSQMSVKAVSSEKNEDEDDSDAEELRLE